MQKVKIQELEKVLLTRRTFSPVREAFFVRILNQFCKLKKILIHFLGNIILKSIVLKICTEAGHEEQIRLVLGTVVRDAPRPQSAALMEGAKLEIMPRVDHSKTHCSLVWKHSQLLPFLVARSF